MDVSEGDQEDPLSLHAYLYCEADPADNSDPSGDDTNLDGMSNAAINFGSLLLAPSPPKFFTRWVRVPATWNSLYGIDIVFSMLWDCRITDQFNIPLVGVPFVENVTVIYSKYVWSLGIRNGKGVTVPGGLLSDPWKCDFKSASGTVCLKQTVTAGNRVATMYDVIYGNGSMSASLRSIFK